MESILRAAFMYVFLMVVIRITGKRTLSEVTVFDFILLLIIGEAAQQGITGNDYSVVNSVIIILTFIVIDFSLAFLKQRSKKIEHFIDGTALIVLQDGKVLKKVIDRTKIDEEDILEAARKTQGLERLEQIKYAILEKDGEISIIPKKTHD